MNKNRLGNISNICILRHIAAMLIPVDGQFYFQATASSVVLHANSTSVISVTDSRMQIISSSREVTCFNRSFDNNDVDTQEGPHVSNNNGTTGYVSDLLAKTNSIYYISITASGRRKATISFIILGVVETNSGVSTTYRT